jgi:hypothetical protein
VFILIGAAQSLAEVAGALGKARSELLLQQLLPNINHPKVYVREGLMWFLTFLPQSLNQQFAPHISTSLSHVIRGLSDESDQVRDIAMKAGSVIVSQFAVTNSESLLPTLEKGVFDENWRIRHCSIQLLGDLLYSISGTRPQGLNDVEVTLDDDATRDNTDISNAILENLGLEVIYSLYICITFFRCQNNISCKIETTSGVCFRVHAAFRYK